MPPDLVDTIRARPGAWDQPEPHTEDQVRGLEAALGLRLDPDHRRLLLALGSGTLIGEDAAVFFEPPLFLEAHHRPPEDYLDAFPGAFLFANDGGDIFFFQDRDDVLGAGPHAVWAAEYSAPFPEDAWRVADDVTEMVGKVLAGESLLPPRYRP